jgi:hypothetical protein
MAEGLADTDLLDLPVAGVRPTRIATTIGDRS